VRTGALRKHGIRIRLQDQSFQILLMLLDHPGEVVLREDIRLRLWPNNTIVEFDHGINAAVKRLRNSLGESAEAPRYIETPAKRGYRFLGEVSEDGQGNPHETQPESSQRQVDGGPAAPRYRILDKLGEGGMGAVYRVDDLEARPGGGVEVSAVGESETPQAALQRFEREARAASALNHPNICTIYGLEDLDGGPAIAMELVEGETLSARLGKGKLPLPEALKVAVQVAAALAEAHRKGVVHCDLKPGNIMLTKAGVKVLDFGLAQMEGVVASGESATDANTILGTAHYMSPEQAQGLETDFRTDIFSFGVVLYEMLTAKRPFEAESAARLRAAILEHEPPALGDAFPAALDHVIHRCLAKNAEDRWQSAQDLGFALAALA
jgi:serine/threonine protein kinase